MYDLYIKNGYKQLITLKCPLVMGKENLKKWWFEHAQRVKKLPGLKLYTVIFTEEETFGPPKPFDGFEEMWFESIGDLRNAYYSKIWQKEIAQMDKDYLYHPQYFQGIWEEGYIVKMTGLTAGIPKSKGLIRLFGGLKRKQNMSLKQIKDWYYLHATMALDKDGKMTIPGIIGYTHSFSIISPYGPSFVDAICGNWWLNLEEIKRDFKYSNMLSQVEHGKESWDYNDLKEAQMTWGEQYIIEID